ncbi:hypothetical protein [Pseudomonas syringae pv. coryli]|uniref:hypothetical protein n=1 Tax=Pseudomonas syringae pv. coryli TaxID=317659 RepID=UPI003D27DCC2
MTDDTATAAPIPERDALYGFLRDAPQWKLQALAELALWMEKHHELLFAGRSDGIRLGATKEVIQFMLDSVNPDVANIVAGNLVQIEN